jgi:hypothetical protein
MVLRKLEEEEEEEGGEEEEGITRGRRRWEGGL